MGKNKTKFIVSLVGLAVCLSLGFSALAAPSPMQVLETAGGNAKYETNPESADIASIIGNVIYAVLSVLGVVFLGFIVYAGFLWMTAKGESSAVQKARDILSNSLIGLIIVVGAYAITYFVLYYLTRGLLQQGAIGL